MFSLVQQLQGVKPFKIVGERRVTLLPKEDYTRECSACGEEKPEDEFYRGHSTCRGCYAEKAKAAYASGENVSEASKRTVLESLKAGNTSATAIHLDTGMNPKTIKAAMRSLEKNGQVKSVGTKPIRYCLL